MSQRKVYEVRPHSQGWQGIVQGAGRASVVGTRKSDVLAQTKNLAKEAPLGQVIVKGKNHQIQTEYTYGSDPKKYQG